MSLRYCFDLAWSVMACTRQVSYLTVFLASCLVLGRNRDAGKSKYLVMIQVLWLNCFRDKFSMGQSHKFPAAGLIDNDDKLRHPTSSPPPFAARRGRRLSKSFRLHSKLHFNAALVALHDVKIYRASIERSNYG